MKIIEINHEQIRRAVLTLTAAFRRDPIFKYIFRSTAKYEKVAPWLFSTWVCWAMLYGKAWMTEDGSTVLLTRTPGMSTMSLWSMIRSGMLLTPFKLGLFTFHRFFFRIVSLLEKSNTRIMKDQPHWYGWMIGSDRSNKEAGRLMLEYYFKQVDKTGLPAYLETESTAHVRFYQQHGYQLVHQHHVFPELTIYFMQRPSKVSLWHKLIDYARWCPSPHNVQPWKIRIVSESEAQLLYDPARIPAIVDGTASFTTAGMGMFIECLDIAAHAEGYQIETHFENKGLDPGANEIKSFALLKLVKTNQAGRYLPELIKQRKTSRLKYNNKKLHPELMEKYSSLVEEHGHKFFYSHDKTLINYAIDLNSRMTLERSKDIPTQLEMQQWIRCTDKEAIARKDGWWYRAMGGISGKMLYNFFYHNEKFQSRRRQYQSRLMLNRMMRGTANLAWISGPFENTSDWINAGIMLQRLWLEMTANNVFMHPFGPVITTKYSFEDFCNRVEFNKADGTLWFLIRMGYSREPHRSLRLDVQDILC